MVKSQQEQFLRLYGKSNNIVRINNSIDIIRIRFSNHAFDHRRRLRTFFDRCPYCYGRQRWACGDCGKKTFSDRTHTALCSSKLKTPQMRKLVSMLSDGTTLRQAKYPRLFSGCKETAVNSKDMAAYGILNPVNRLCAQVKRRFVVHLRIHRKNVHLWLSEKAFQRERMGNMGFDGYLSFFYKTIFLFRKTLRRREVFSH